MPTQLASPVSEICGVYYYERPKQGFRFTAYSPPGHLLHLVTEGEVEQQCNGRAYRLKKGDMLWYHDNEFVEGATVVAPWCFYSVVFDAPGLPPPEFSRRLVHSPASRKAGRSFKGLFEAWNSPGLSGLERSLRCHVSLLELLILFRAESGYAAIPALHPNWLTELWWKIENAARADLARHHTLEELADLGGVSPATAHRASTVTVGLSPVRRIKALRLEMIRGLLMHSTLSVSEIAEKAGYERVNELSRDYRAQFGMPPSHARKRA